MHGLQRHTNKPICTVYADKVYAGRPNRNFLSDYKIADGIMRKDSTAARLTEREIKRSKKIAKVRYIVEQYFGISHPHDKAKRARFTTMMKNNQDAWFRQAAFNVFRRMKILPKATGSKRGLRPVEVSSLGFQGDYGHMRFTKKIWPAESTGCLPSFNRPR